MGEVQTSAGTVVPFPGSASRRSRAALRDGDPRGEILLFTGVRYERLPAPSSEPSPAARGQAKPGRGRRRSWKPRWPVPTS